MNPTTGMVHLLRGARRAVDRAVATLTFSPTGSHKALTHSLTHEPVRSNRISALAMVLVAIICTCGMGVTQAAEIPAFYDIGALPGPNFPSSGLDGVSPDGAVAVGNSGSTIPTTAGVRWSAATGLAPLGNEAGFIYTIGRDASLNGAYICGYQQLPGTFQYLAFRLDTSGVSTDLGDLPGGSANTLATSISRDGQTIVGLGNFAFGVDGDEGFVWTPTTGIRGIGFLPGGNISQALAVSGNGQVIVGNSNNAAGLSLAVRSTPQGLVSLGDLPGGIEDSGANDVSFDGSTIVGRSNSANGYEGYRWTAATGMQPLGDLPGGMFVSTPLDVTDDGSTIIGYSHTGINVGGTVGEEAFIWDAAHGMRNLKQVLEADHGLKLAGWTLTRANAMSADGSVIVGSGIIGGARRGWVAVIPEPSCLALAAAGFCGIIPPAWRLFRSRHSRQISTPARQT